MNASRRLRDWGLVAVIYLSLGGSFAPVLAGPKVNVLRVPHGGIQPQAMVDAAGVVHLIYFQGEPMHGDVFYVRSRDGASFSEPIRVNSQPGSVIAVGNIRGAHLAVGRNGRVHVAWMGSGRAEPKAPGEANPMLYARLNDAGTGFEPQRNVIRSAVGLDGGGSVAADGAGNVYVAWHAPTPGTRGEENRRVWLTRSSDDGQTFAPEQAVSPAATGACGCCGMRAYCDRKGNVYVLYRGATEKVHRDAYLLVSRDHGATFQSEDVGRWDINACPMSSFTFAEGGGHVLAGWETDGQVSFAALDPATGRHADPVTAPGASRNRKHPATAANDSGETLFVWTTDMGWNHGGDLAWQVYKAGEPTAEHGRVRGVPTWSLVAVVARPDGGFTILY